MIEKKAAAGKPADDFIRIQDLWGVWSLVRIQSPRQLSIKELSS